MKIVNIYYVPNIGGQVTLTDVNYIWRNRFKPVWDATEDYVQATIRQISEELERHEKN